MNIHYYVNTGDLKHDVVESTMGGPLRSICVNGMQISTPVWHFIYIGSLIISSRGKLYT